MYMYIYLSTFVHVSSSVSIDRYYDNYNGYKNYCYTYVLICHNTLLYRFFTDN